MKTMTANPGLITARRPARFGRAAHWSLGVAAWALLVTAALLTALLLGWVLLGLALLGSGPYAAGAPVPWILLALLGSASSLAWLTTHYFAPWRVVGRAIGLVVALVLLVGTTWALSAPNAALYYAREIAWGGNDAPDYAKAMAQAGTGSLYSARFPQRAVNNVAPVFHFPQNQSTQLFQTIRYQQGGQVRQTSLGEFMRATQTTSFIVIQDGAILAERYGSGFTRDSVVTSFSMAKSFMSALVGIAMHEGYIGGLDDRMVAYLPELRGRGLDNTTIRDLLTMSAGISTRNTDALRLLGLADDPLTTNYPDLRVLALSVKAGADAPGTAFSYSNYDAQLLGLILERTTHRPVAQYLQEKIWQPLGMEYPASWTLDSTQSGFEKMAMGLNARAIDLAKFGQLYLDNGNWNGAQIIPADWVKESTAPDRADNRPWRTSGPWKAANGYYQYLWWGVTRPDGSYAYMARGNLQQQFIYVSPRDRVVIVRLGLVDGSADWWPDVFQSVIDKVNANK